MEKLWFATLANSIRDLGRLVCDYRAGKFVCLDERREILYWFEEAVEGKEEDKAKEAWPCSFFNICDHFDLSPTCIRAGVFMMYEIPWHEAYDLLGVQKEEDAAWC